MGQIHQAMARLRLLLAEISGKEEELDATIKQFRAQLTRLPVQTAYGRTSLSGALSAMMEMEERLAHAETMKRHLLAIKERSRQELEALELTLRVEEAKETLAAMYARLREGGERDLEAESNIRRLEEFIAEYSQRAGRTITDASAKEKKG